MSNYGLLVAFPDQSETFVLGFEAGQCWERLVDGDLSDRTIHSANSEVVRRIARSFNMDVTILPTDVDGWSTAMFARGRPKLSVVGSSPQGSGGE